MSLRSIEKHDPFTGAVLYQYTAASQAQVDSAVAVAHAALPAWQQSPWRVRQDLLRHVARQIQQQGDALAALIHQETGKPLKDAMEAELVTAVGILTYDARVGPGVLRDRRLPIDKSLLMGRIHYQRHVPWGVVAVIAPWNYPFAIAVSGVAAALMAGNTVILKPSEWTCRVGEAVVRLFQNALAALGYAVETVQVLPGDGVTGQALVDAPIDHVVFTGSEKTGHAIRQSLQARGKSVCLELGGSDPLVVLPGADLDAVAAYALWGRFTNAGQTCSAVKRLLVHRTLHDALVDVLAQKIRQLRWGASPDCHLGPLISAGQRDIIANQVADAVAQGATVVTGGELPPGPGYYYPPTLLTHVPPTARVLQEETFGPVVPVIPFETEAEAIALANGHRYGLTAGVFGKNAAAVARRLHAGAVAVNDVGTTLYALPAVPWTGWRFSGPGVSHGVAGLRALTQLQTLSVNLLYFCPGFRKQPWHFSPSGGEADGAFSRALLRAFATDRWRDKLSVSFLAGFWRNRSSRKL